MGVAIGVDGTRQAWVAVVLVDGRYRQTHVVRGVAELLARYGAVPTAVDIPIGFTDAGVRDADAAARRILGPRSASVFSAPCRSVVDRYLEDPLIGFDDANRLSRQVTGRGLSSQSWGLLPKIAEIDDLVAGTADLFEVHPEVSFRLAGAEPLPRKKTWNGLQRRRGLIRELGVDLPDDLPGGDRVAADDVLDAAIAAWTAAGSERGELVSHPGRPAQRDRGRAIAIWSRRR